MEPLIFAMNAVMPIVLMTVLGYGLNRTGLISRSFAEEANTLVFRLLLPLFLFVSIYESESLSGINWSLVVFSMVGMQISFFVGLLLVRRLVPEGKRRGVVLQCVFRSNYSILGLPLAMSLFGIEGAQLAAVTTLFVIPQNNILALVGLRMFDTQEGKRYSVGGMLRDIAGNRIIQGVLAGLIVLCVRALFERFGIAFRLRDIRFFYAAFTTVSQMTAPLSLMALGALFTISSVRGMLREIVLGTVMRVVVVPAIALSIAYLWFPALYGAPFAVLIAVFASPVAVTSAVMASELGGDGELGGQLVVWTTLTSTVTIFLFVSTFRALGALG